MSTNSESKANIILYYLISDAHICITLSSHVLNPPYKKKESSKTLIEIFRLV